jgi:type VI protein secretion system component VasF
MAETETDSNLAPRELVTEIERTRADLARTIDEIADRVTPSKVAQRASARVREQVSQIDPLIGGAVALAVVSVTCYFLWRRIKK